MRAGLVVKVNSVLIPGVNDIELPAVAMLAAEYGAHLSNILPLIPQARFRTTKPPGPAEIHAARAACGEYLSQMTHCNQCRADACGLIGKDRDMETETLMARLGDDYCEVVSVMKAAVEAPFKITAMVARGVASGLVALALALGATGCAGTAPAASAPHAAPPPAPSRADRLGGGVAQERAHVDRTCVREGERRRSSSFNFGASGQLVKQIEGGAPVDVFLSASPAAVDDARWPRDSRRPRTSVTFAGNTLVILVPKGNPAGIHGA